MRIPRMISVALALSLGGSAASLGETNLSLSLANPGSNTVKSGAKVTIEIRATSNTRLSAASFKLSATGAVNLKLIDRSAKPTEPNGLTYVSRTSQVPFEDDLPVNLRTASSLEVLYDSDFGAAPGSATDGVPPGNGVVIERITLRPRGLGSILLRLTEVSAVHATASPSGSLFDVSSVGAGVIPFTVIGGGPGDFTGDGFITLTDHAQLPACITGPDRGPVSAGCQVFKFDGDDDVDLNDIAEYMTEFGPAS